MRSHFVKPSIHGLSQLVSGDQNLERKMPVQKHLLKFTETQPQIKPPIWFVGFDSHYILWPSLEEWVIQQSHHHNHSSAASQFWISTLIQTFQLHSSCHARPCRSSGALCQAHYLVSSHIPPTPVLLLQSNLLQPFTKHCTDVRCLNSTDNHGSINKS